MWPVAEACLGEGAALDPRLCALTATAKASPLDMSGAPTRDNTYAESYDKHGNLRLMKVVAMLGHSSPNNGGLTVLPREYDDFFTLPEAWEHLNPSEETEPNVLSIKFGIQALRPIQVPKGSVVGMAGNLVHWQSRCRQTQVSEASASIQALFRGPEAGPAAYESDPIEKETVRTTSLADRVCHIAKALMLEAVEGKVAAASFPPAFRGAL